MKRSRFLALAMCYAFLAGMPAKAMKDLPAKKLEDRNKIVDFTVNLVKENPVKSFFTILFGSVLLEEGIRRGCKRSKSSEIKSNTQININDIKINNTVPVPPVNVLPMENVSAYDILKDFKFRYPGYRSHLTLVGSLDFFPKSFKDFINRKKSELRTFFDSGLGNCMVFGKSIFLSDEVVDDILNSEDITERKLSDEEKALIKNEISFVICPYKTGNVSDYDPKIPHNKYLKGSGQLRGVKINFMYVNNEDVNKLVEYDKNGELDMCKLLKCLCYFDYYEMKKCKDITIFDDIKQYWAAHEQCYKIYIV